MQGVARTDACSARFPGTFLRQAPWPDLRALRPVALASGFGAARFAAFGDVRLAAVRLLARDPRTIDRALTAQFLDTRVTRRTWSGFVLGDPDRIEVRNDPASPLLLRALDLSSLGTDRPFDIRPEDWVEATSLEKLTLLGPSSAGLRVSFSGVATLLGDETLPAPIDRCLAPRSPLTLPGWRVTDAEMRIVCAPEPGSKRGRTSRLRLSIPNRTNLRDFTDRHRLLVDGLPARRGLYAAIDD